MFKAKAFSKENLLLILREITEVSAEFLETKQHASYFYGYLGELGAKTIIAEYEYVDHDYLEDFAGYYVKCFEDYKRKCGRMHFFSEEFDEDSLFSFLKNENKYISSEKLQESYLGFIVIKKLPQTIIGRTCIATYPTHETNRKFTALREYSSNLFGIPLSVKSLAFQEQDQVVAACATSALWSAFHATGPLFSHTIPSPVEITHMATEVISEVAPRSIPNDGLTPIQMLHAIRRVGLESILINAQDEFLLKSSLAAYLKCSIPIILHIGLYDVSGTTAKHLGDHAIVIVGYCEEDKDIDPHDPSNFKLRSSRIDKIYVHDEQIGPFARMEFDGIQVNELIEGKTIKSNSMTTTWDENGNTRAVPIHLIVPIYNKIRIPFATIKSTIMVLDAIVEALRSNSQLSLSNRIDWDIYLTTNNKYKENINTSKHIAPEDRFDILTKSMPRFLWHAIAYCDNSEVLELTFDATDIDQGSFFMGAIRCNDELFEVLAEISKGPEVGQIVSEIIDELEEQHIEEFTGYQFPVMNIINWFASQP